MNSQGLVQNHTFFWWACNAAITPECITQNRWNKAIWGWLPLLTIIPVTSQWGHYTYIYIYVCIYTYIYIYVCNSLIYVYIMICSSLTQNSKRLVLWLVMITCDGITVHCFLITESSCLQVTIAEPLQTIHIKACLECHHLYHIYNI